MFLPEKVSPTKWKAEQKDESSRTSSQRVGKRIGSIIGVCGANVPGGFLHEDGFGMSDDLSG